jgi:hypothetical protein
MRAIYMDGALPTQLPITPVLKSLYELCSAAAGARTL